MVSLTADMSPLHPDRNLALELVRATEAAAIRAVPFIGRGDEGGRRRRRRRRDAGVLHDRQLRRHDRDRRGREGRGAHALQRREGRQRPRTAVRRRGRPDRRHLADRRRPQQRALGDRGVRPRHDARRVDACSTWTSSSPAPPGVGVVDIRLPIGENIRLLAKALGKPVDEIVVSVLQPPAPRAADRRDPRGGRRHAPDDATATSPAASTRRATTPAPTCASASAAAPRASSRRARSRRSAVTSRGGSGRATTTRSRRASTPVSKLDGYVYEADELVTGSNTIFVATGVTDGQLVAGVRREGDFIYTESVVLRGASGTLRRIVSEHLVSKWL